MPGRARGDELVFDGGSFALNKQGELVAQVKRTLYVRSKPQHRGG